MPRLFIGLLFLFGQAAGTSVLDGTSTLLVGASQVALNAGIIRSQRVAAEYAGQASPAGTYAETSRRTLSGSFGSANPPALTSFISLDPMNADEWFGDGDLLVLRFDCYTTESGVLTTKLAVDAILGFSASLGLEYSGAWSECYEPEPPPGRFCRTLTITTLVWAFLIVCSAHECI